MAWQTLLVQNPAALKRQNNQLLCKDPLSENFLTLPVEDLAVVILESPQINISSALLSYLQDQQVVVMTCDNQHMPNGLLMPFHQHSRFTQVAILQSQWSEPFKKRCWQSVIQSKIRNQVRCLQKSGIADTYDLEALIPEVQSGDKTNREAVAARLYWVRLFGKEFQRFHEESVRSNALNYGYAILRSCMARAVTAAGLIPCFGLHHSSQLNAFNLVDDLIEPFRPLVDDLVAHLDIDESSHPKGELSLHLRQQLALIGGRDCRIESEIHTLLRACELMAFSLVNAAREKDWNLLKLPELI